MVDQAVLACPKRKAGDLQLETVLSPLFLRRRQRGGYPKTSIFDYGCGRGDLLHGLKTFSPLMLGQIRYVGVDTDHKAIERARAVAAEADDSVPRTTPLTQTLADCSILHLSEIGGVRPDSFDIVHAVNVLHHVVDTDDLYTFLDNSFALLKVGGHLIVEDFFFGDYPANLDWERYSCEGAVYWGPPELAIMLAVEVRERGTYRFFRKESPPKKERCSECDRVRESRSERLCYFGYTFTVRRLKSIMSSGSLFAPLFDRGYHYALHRMHSKAVAAKAKGAPGYAEYDSAVLCPLVRKAEKSIYVPYPSRRNDDRRRKLRWLYDDHDPYPRRHWPKGTVTRA